MSRYETERKLKKQKLMIVLHHGKLNSLPRTCTLPKRIYMINLIDMWLRGSKKYNVPPFRYLVKTNVSHIKNGAGILSKMKQVIKKTEEFGQDDKVWISEILCSGSQFTML